MVLGVFHLESNRVCIFGEFASVEEDHVLCQGLDSDVGTARLWLDLLNASNLSIHIISYWAEIIPIGVPPLTAAYQPLQLLVGGN